MNGQILNFGVSGKLIMNALVMFDRETESLWSHFLSESIAGPFEGTRLTNVPLVLTTWGEWKRSFPETLALHKSGFGFDPYESYYRRGDAGVIGESNRDDRLGRKELVLGLGFDDGPIAFSHSELSKNTVINYELNGSPIVVVYYDETATANAFSRVIGDETLEFDFEVDEEDGRGWLVDKQTGTRWLPFTGQAWEGELRGSRLEPVHAVNVFWFAWNDFYPETTIYNKK